MSIERHGATDLVGDIPIISLIRRMRRLSISAVSQQIPDALAIDRARHDRC